MTVLLPLVLNFVQAYGYPVLGLASFIAAFGVPLPMTLVLLAAGAFAAAGDFNVGALLGVATASAVAGDCAGYVVGRLWGSRVLEWLPCSRVGRRFITAHAVERSRVLFRRHGGWAIFLTRTLVSALGSVTNLVAGAETYPAGRFVFFDLAGEAVGAVLSLGLGFVAGAGWEEAGDILGGVSLFVVGLAALVVLARLLLRELRRDKRPK